jgi:hypothetical protein
MRIAARNALRRLADQCLVVAAVLIARFRRGEAADGVEARLRARPARDRAMIVAATLGALLGASLLAAQGGVFGMAVFFGAVVLLVG